MIRAAQIVALAGVVACGHATQAIEPTVPISAARPPPEPKTNPNEPTLASVLSHPPDIVLTIRPQAIARDRVYGSLIRKASALASAYAGAPNLGTTTLAVLERTFEVVAALNDDGREAVVVMRGVPSDADPLRIVDERGTPLWRPAEGDVRTRLRELAPTTPAEAALFVLPGLVWVVASGPAVGITRSALLGPIGDSAFAGVDTTLAALSMQGQPLVRREPKLRSGPLGALGTGLMRAKLELTPGTSGLILAELEYANVDLAAAAQKTVSDVVLAFRRRLEDAATKSKGDGTASGAAKGMDWLGTAVVERTNGIVKVRVPVPRRWLDALAAADLTPPGSSH